MCVRPFHNKCQHLLASTGDRSLKFEIQPGWGAQRFVYLCPVIVVLLHGCWSRNRTHGTWVHVHTNFIPILLFKPLHLYTSSSLYQQRQSNVAMWERRGSSKYRKCASRRGVENVTYQHDIRQWWGWWLQLWLVVWSNWFQSWKLSESISDNG